MASLVEQLAKRYKLLDEAVRTGADPTDILSHYVSQIIKKDGKGPSLRLAHLGALTPEAKAAAQARPNEPIWFVTTTAQVDRDGDLVIPRGIDTTDFENNPVIDLGHYESLAIPIAKGVDANGKLMWETYDDYCRGGALFNPKSSDSMFIREMILDGYLGAASIAFVPLEAYKREPEMHKANPRSQGGQQPMGYVFKRVSLTGWACVNVPANAGALRDIRDRQAKSISKGMFKALTPYCATAQVCWNGWCSPVAKSCKPCETVSKSMSWSELNNLVKLRASQAQALKDAVANGEYGRKEKPQKLQQASNMLNAVQEAGRILGDRKLTDEQRENSIKSLFMTAMFMDKSFSQKSLPEEEKSVQVIPYRGKFTVADVGGSNPLFPDAMFPTYESAWQWAVGQKINPVKRLMSRLRTKAKTPQLRWDIYVNGKFVTTEWTATKAQAEELARDLGNYRANEKVEAKNPSRGDKSVRKFSDDWTQKPTSRGVDPMPNGLKSYLRTKGGLFSPNELSVVHAAKKNRYGAPGWYVLNYHEPQAGPFKSKEEANAAMQKLLAIPKSYRIKRIDADEFLRAGFPLFVNDADDREALEQYAPRELQALREAVARNQGLGVEDRLRNRGKLTAAFDALKTKYDAMKRQGKGFSGLVRKGAKETVSALRQKMDSVLRATYKNDKENIAAIKTLEPDVARAVASLTSASSTELKTIAADLKINISGNADKLRTLIRQSLEGRVGSALRVFASLQNSVHKHTCSCHGTCGKCSKAKAISSGNRVAPLPGLKVFKVGDTVVARRRLTFSMKGGELYTFARPGDRVKIVEIVGGTPTNPMMTCENAAGVRMQLLSSNTDVRKKLKALNESSGMAGGYTVEDEMKTKLFGFGSGPKDSKGVPIKIGDGVEYRMGGKVKWDTVRNIRGISIDTDGGDTIAAQAVTVAKSARNGSMKNKRTRTKADDQEYADDTTGVDDTDDDKGTDEPTEPKHGAQVLAKLHNHLKEAQDYMTEECAKMDHPGLSEALMGHGGMEKMCSDLEGMHDKNYPDQDFQAAKDFVASNSSDTVNQGLEGEDGYTEMAEDPDDEVTMGEDEDSEVEMDLDSDEGLHGEQPAADVEMAEGDEFVEGDVEDGEDEGIEEEAAVDDEDGADAATEEILDRYRQPPKGNRRGVVKGDTSSFKVGQKVEMPSNYFPRTGKITEIRGNEAYVDSGSAGKWVELSQLKVKSTQSPKSNQYGVRKLLEGKWDTKVGNKWRVSVRVGGKGQEYVGQVIPVSGKNGRAAVRLEKVVEDYGPGDVCIYEVDTTATKSAKSNRQEVAKARTQAKFKIGQKVVYDGSVGTVDNVAEDSRGWVYSVVFGPGNTNILREEKLQAKALKPVRKGGRVVRVRQLVVKQCETGEFLRSMADAETDPVKRAALSYHADKAMEGDDMMDKDELPALPMGEDEEANPGEGVAKAGDGDIDEELEDVDKAVGEGDLEEELEDVHKSGPSGVQQYRHSDGAIYWGVYDKDRLVKGPFHDESKARAAAQSLGIATKALDKGDLEEELADVGKGVKPAVNGQAKKRKVVPKTLERNHNAILNLLKRTGLNLGN